MTYVLRPVWTCLYRNVLTVSVDVITIRPKVQLQMLLCASQFILQQAGLTSSLAACLVYQHQDR